MLKLVDFAYYAAVSIKRMTYIMSTNPTSLSF